MRLATLQTDNGPEVVVVMHRRGVDYFFCPRLVDETLPRSLKAVLEAPDGLERVRAALQQAEDKFLVKGRLLAPIPDPGKVICIGLNYRDHATESGMEIPEEPVCFSKFTSAIIGPEEPIRLPAAARKVDYEAELVVIIGKTGRQIPPDQAMRHVAGYTCGHDVSARDWQIGKPGGQWLLGKAADTFAPIGPWMTTADEILDPNQLGIKLYLNGQVMQASRTSQFIFDVDELISYVSLMITLQPGDIIFTGTPPGVGSARKPPVWLKAGDRVDVEIEALGVLSNPVEQL